MDDKVIVEIPDKFDDRWKSWAKVLAGVDRTKTNGYAFQGEFVKLGRKTELEVGSYVLLYREEGSTKYHRAKVEIVQVKDDGRLETVLYAVGSDWALELRDQVADLLDEPPLSGDTALHGGYIPIYAVVILDMVVSEQFVGIDAAFPDRALAEAHAARCNDLRNAQGGSTLEWRVVPTGYHKALD